jgi:hypothetical protein
MPFSLNFFSLFNVIVANVLSVSIDEEGESVGLLGSRSSDSLFEKRFLNGGVPYPHIIHFSLGFPWTCINSNFTKLRDISDQIVLIIVNGFKRYQQKRDFVQAPLVIYIRHIITANNRVPLIFKG